MNNPVDEIVLSSDEEPEVQEIISSRRCGEIGEAGNGTLDTSKDDSELQLRIQRQDEVSEMRLLPLPEWDLPALKRRHECNEQCVALVQKEVNGNDKPIKVCSPYYKPLQNGWKRNGRVYEAPCGKSFDRMEDIASFLKATRSTERFGLSIEHFVLDSCVRPELIAIGNGKELCKDISLDKEDMPIRVVNNVDDDDRGPKLTYTNKRFVTSWHSTADEEEGEPLYTEFCAGCSCQDNCQDEEKCECIQRTKTEVSRLCPSLRPKKAFGYAWKYLQNPTDIVYSGVYECNQHCACNSQCPNRVAQLPISIPLEVYKTAEIGWGVRTMVDLPPGRFVCTYAAAVRDFVYSTVDHDSRFYSSLDFYQQAEEKKGENTGFNLVNHFGRDHLFVLDAKRMGNIGGLFNHSCDPNMRVHCVFYDTHDIRLPLQALFTNRFVPAGSPLTWHYAYEEGQEKGTAIYCKCGSSKCCQRLL